MSILDRFRKKNQTTDESEPRPSTSPAPRQTVANTTPYMTTYSPAFYGSGSSGYGSSSSPSSDGGSSSSSGCYSSSSDGGGGGCDGGGS